MSQEFVTTVGQFRSELEDYLDVSHRRRRLFPRAALVGLCAGGAAVIFRLLLVGGDTLRNALLRWAHQFPVWGWIFPVLISATGTVIAVFLVQRFAPEASGSGIPHLKAVMQRLREIEWRRLLTVKMAGGVLALGSGLALGREGPTVQIGGAVGHLIANILKDTARDRLTLTAAGAGAGLAAAFNAPLSGLVFVLEEVQRDFRRGVFGAAFIASAVATIVARLFLGQSSIFNVPHYPAPPIATLPGFAVLGILAGLLGVAFNRGLLFVLDFFAIIQQRSTLTLAAAVGALVGLIGWFAPIAVGSGHSLAELVLVGQISLALLPFWFLLRFGLTLVSYGTSAPGGIFAPMLVLGALIGLAVGHIAHWLAPLVVPDAGVFAVVGMAAYFAAIVRAPLTGIVLIMEMTGDYEQMLPLLISCFCAYAVAEWLRDLPIYEALLERDLFRRGLHQPFHQPRVIEMAVEPGAPFVGQSLRALDLPIGCLVVRCHLNGAEWVPTADTILAGHMRITAVIAPNAPNALAVLRHGCTGVEDKAPE